MIFVVESLSLLYLHWRGSSSVIKGSSDTLNLILNWVSLFKVTYMSCERVYILFIMMFQLVVMYFPFDSNINFGRDTILLSKFFFVIEKKL